MDLEHSRKVQSGIFLNQGVYFEYTQLLPGVEMFQLILGARGAPLISKYDFWEKGGKSDNQSFYKKEDIVLHPFFLQILSISSTSMHFSGKKEVSSKKGNSCT